MRRALKPELPTTAAAPGRILDAAGVAALLCLDDPSSEKAQEWVRENVPGKRRIGHKTVRWLERDVVAWVESKGDAA